MQLRTRCFAFTTGLALLTGGLWLAVGWAQDAKTPAPEKLLPADPVLYIGWDGSEAHRAALQKTAAYEALANSGLDAILARFLAYADMHGGGGFVRQMLDGAGHLLQQGFQLTVGLPNAGDGAPTPQITIVVPGAGGSFDEVQQFLQQLTPARMETETEGSRTVSRVLIPQLFPGAEVGIWAEGRHLVITIGAGAVETALNVAAGKAPSLERSPVLKKYRAKAGFDVALTTWLDVGQIRQTFGEQPVTDPAAGRKATVNDVLKALGLDRVGPAAMRVGFKGKALWSETTIEAPGPRTGLLAWDDKPLSLEELPPLPAGTDGFYATRLNFAAAGKGLAALGNELSRLLDGKDAPGFEVQLNGVQQQIGINFQKDFFETLGNLVVVYGDTRQGVMGLGSGLAISVKDAPTLRDTLERLTPILVPAAGPMAQFDTVERAGRNVSYLNLPFFPVITPAWAVDDKWLIVGLSPQTVDVFLRRVDGKLERWAPPADVKAALAELPAKYTSLTYADPREGYRTILGAAPMLGTVMLGRALGMGQPGMPVGVMPGMMGPQASPFSLADLPAAEVVTQPLFANVSVGTQTDQEFRWTSRSSLPAVPFLGGAGIGSAGSSAPILAALLLPAVQQAREAARRTQSKNNLKQIGLALHNYHDVNNQFPPGTHETEGLKPEQRLSWQAEILPYVDQAPAYNQLSFDKGWEDEANLNVLQMQLPVYQNPALIIDRNGKVGHTHYVGIAGLGKDGPLLEVNELGAGIFGYNRGCSLRDITDGTSNTIAVSEAIKDFGGWGQGGPSTVRALTQKPYIKGPDGLGGPWQGGMHVLFADGSVRFISENINPEILEALTTIAGGELINQF